MAKKPNLSAALDNLPAIEQRNTQPPTRPRRGASPALDNTVLVGANLAPSYARNLALLHAETGRSKKDLLQEALDMLFVSKGGAQLSRS